MITPAAEKRCAEHSMQAQLAAHRAELAALRTDASIKQLEVLLLERRIANQDFGHEDRRLTIGHLEPMEPVRHNFLNHSMKIEGAD